MQISIVIPLFNEEESLPELMAWIDKILNEYQFSAEVIMIDDGSKDNSWEVIRQLKAQYTYLKGVRFRTNYGKSGALQVGFELAEGDVVITMDADMQDSPDEIPALYKMVAEEGYEMVSGYKKVRHDSVIMKNLPSKLYNFIARKVSGINNLHDFNCGLKAYNKEVVKNIEVYGEMHRWIPVLAKWAGFDKITEKVVVHRARKYGISKFGLNRFINGLLDLMSLVVTQKYFKKPMHFFGTWGVFFSLVGGSMLLYLFIIRTFLNIWLKERMPAMIFGTVSLIIGIIFFCTGLLGEIIGRNSPSRNSYKIRDRV